VGGRLYDVMNNVGNGLDGFGFYFDMTVEIGAGWF